jgi:hypothetical protein
MSFDRKCVRFSDMGQIDEAGVKMGNTEFIGRVPAVADRQNRPRMVSLTF